MGRTDKITRDRGARAQGSVAREPHMHWPLLEGGNDEVEPCLSPWSSRGSVVGDCVTQFVFNSVLDGLRS